MLTRLDVKVTAADAEVRYVRLAPGDPAPWFIQRTPSNPEFRFHTVAGRYVVLCIFGSSHNEIGRRAVSALLERRTAFDDTNISCFGVTLDPSDERAGVAQDRPPGVRFFLDYDGEVSRLYGALPSNQDLAAGMTRLRPLWIVLDPLLRVSAVFPFTMQGGEVQDLFDYLATLPPPAQHAGIEVQAPVLVLPRVFDQELCQRLIHAYETGDQTGSGVMQQAGAMTVEVHNPGFKVRRDHVLKDQELIGRTRACISGRILPEIRRAFQFQATRMERFVVACYPADGGGHFKPHRDNTTAGTAHRRFAVSINLNEDFEGGEIGFPEYGPATFKPQPGAAVVFSCGLLHCVSVVTRGRRYAFLPFLYDEEAATIRQANAHLVGSSEPASFAQDAL